MLKNVPKTAVRAQDRSSKKKNPPVRRAHEPAAAFTKRMLVVVDAFGAPNLPAYTAHHEALVFTVSVAAVHMGLGNKVDDREPIVSHNLPLIYSS